MKKVLYAIITVCFFTFMTCAVANANPQYRIKFGYSATAKEVNYLTFEKEFKSYVEKASNGRLAVDLYPNAQLGGERQMLEGLTLGTIEMAMLSPGIAAGMAPKFQVLDLPYIFKDSEAAYKTLDGKLLGILNEQLNPKGVRLLCFAENGFRHVTNNKQIIKSPSDLKGVKLRVQPIPAHIELFKALGANPTPVDFGELYTALLQKTVDAQENSITLIYSSKLYEVQKYLTMTEHVYSPSAVFIAERFYKNLPEDLQKIVMEGGARFSSASRANQQIAAKELIGDLEKNGVNVYFLTDSEKEAFVKAAEPVYKIMEPIIGADLMNLVRPGK